MTLQGKVVAITGASSGIGEATARHLASLGVPVVLGARRADRLAELVAEIEAGGGQAAATRVDVTDPGDLKTLVDVAVERFGRLDVFVGNAGIAELGPLADLDVDGWSAMVDVNLKGILHGIAAALPVFQVQGGGHFVTVVSTAGLRIVPTQAVYAGTKNAVRTLRASGRRAPTAACGRRRSHRATSAPNSPATPNSGSTPRRWPGRSPSRSSSPTTSKSAI